MTIPSRNASLWVARTSLAIVVLSFTVFGAWTAGDLLGRPSAQKKTRVEEEEETPKAKAPANQKKRVEEEEDAPRKKPKLKVIPIPVEEEEDANTKSGTKRPAAGGDLAQLAEQSAHPSLKALYRSLAVPYDLVRFKPTSVTVDGEKKQREDRSEEKIEPTPLYLGDHPDVDPEVHLRFTPLPVKGKPQKPYPPIVLRIKSVQPYEKIAQDKVRSFLHETYDRREASDALYLSRYDMLKAAEQVLSSVLRWHESAIQTGKRSGAKWGDVEKALRKQVLDEVFLEQMKLLARAEDWDRVLDLTHRLTVTYGNADERVFRPIANMIEAALKNPTSSEDKKQNARRRLHELEMEFPDNRAFRPLSQMLRQQAQNLLDRAKESASAKKDERARGYLQQAEETWPQLPGLREFKVQLGMEYPILRVGVRGPLPKYFSPAWACTDNERRAVEMLFESLVKPVPDEAGGFRYCRGLAESPPQVVPLGRQFDLPRNAFWSDGRRLNSTDIMESLSLLQAGKGGGRSRVWGEMLAAAEPMKSPYQVTLRMRQGFLDSLALMTFKILPRDQVVPVTSEEFARKPVTSGPFLLDSRLSEKSDETNRICLVFTANPSYSQRPSKRRLPHIQEVRFYTYANDPAIIAEDLRRGKLDLVLDLTAKEVEELKKQKADIEIPMPSPAKPNRRIYFLAINTRIVNDPKQRLALSCAIDREGLLNKHFRASLKTLHKALCGPFPMNSWACEQNNKANGNLFKPDQANLLMQNVKPGSFKLKYAADNPTVDEAMKDLCTQVKERTGIVLEPMPCSPYQLREDVEQTKNYDLAYYHYDFPDESYWLEPLLGPPPGADKDQTNIFKFQNVDVSKSLEGTKSYRAFVKVQEHQWLTQKLLNREMPFIPLWQLDPLLAYSRDVQPAALDPLLVFGNIEEWRLERK